MSCKKYVKTNLLIVCGVEMFKMASESCSQVIKKNDEWSIKVQPPEKVIVPSFIRLFIMARILNHCNVSVDQIKQMVTVIKYLQQQVAQDILIRLTNDGIKKYMQKWFSEKEQAQVIEMIFKRIIFKQFEKEYQTIMTYNDKKKSQYYQRLVFNTDDLMCLIFQFTRFDATFTGDLINCSLVNSHWLYQSWNLNSIYYLDLDTLINTTMSCNAKVCESSHKSDTSNDYNWRQGLDRILSSKWQRVANVKSVQFWVLASSKYKLYELEYFLKKIAMLRNIVNIRVYISDNYMALLKPLLYYNKENIKKYSVLARTEEQNKLKPLKLINANSINLASMYYYIRWSCRCQILRLNVHDVDGNWIKYVIDNCDCRGVQTLTIENISFSDSLNVKMRSTQLLCNKFAQKFENLQRLKIKQYSNEKNGCLILLLRCLNPIIKKNNIPMSLRVDSSFHDGGMLVKMIQDVAITICQLAIRIEDEESNIIDCLKPIVLKNSQLEYLKITNWAPYENVAQKSIINLLLAMEKENSNSKVSSDDKSANIAKLPLSSLRMIHIDDEDPRTSINTINQILALKLIKQHKLYLKLVYQLRAKHSNVSQKSFKTMCQTVASLLICKEIAIELDVTIYGIKTSHFKNTYYPIFKQYLIQDARKNCKASVVNKYCNLLPTPVISLKFKQDDDDDDDSCDDSNGKMQFQVSIATENDEIIP